MKDPMTGGNVPHFRKGKKDLEQEGVVQEEVGGKDLDDAGFCGPK